MIRVEERYSRTVAVSGVNYHHIIYEVFDLGDFVDVLSLGLSGKIIDFADYLLPDLSICEYLPREIASGASFQMGAGLIPLWYAPENLHLLSADINAGSFDRDILHLFVLQVDAVYTRYAPDDSGVTLSPQYDPSYYDPEPFISTSDGYSLVMPSSGFDQEPVMADIPYRRRGPTSANMQMSYSSKFLHLWNGAIPSTTHFLYPDNLEQFIFRTDIPWDAVNSNNMLGLCRVLGDYFGLFEYDLLNDPPWVFPDVWYDREESFVSYDYTDWIAVFVYLFPYQKPPKLVYSPTELPQNFLPFLRVPGGYSEAPLFGGNSPSQAVAVFQPFEVWSEQFIIRGEPFEVRE